MVDNTQGNILLESSWTQFLAGTRLICVHMQRSVSVCVICIHFCRADSLLQDALLGTYEKISFMIGQSSYLITCKIIVTTSATVVTNWQTVPLPSPAFTHIKYTHTLNKKSLNGQGKSMVMVLRRKFLVQLRNLHDFTATVFSWVNEEIYMSSFQQGKYCESRFSEVNHIIIWLSHFLECRGDKPDLIEIYFFCMAILWLSCSQVLPEYVGRNRWNCP